MKKLSILSLLFFAALVGQAQLSEICPPGQTQIGTTFTIEKFNFHKPRTNCTSGFGLCVKGRWKVKCGYAFPSFPRIEDEKVIIAYKVTDNKLELHLPVDLADDPEFKEVDMTTFSIGADQVQLTDEKGNVVAVLKEGDYAVTRTETELIVLIEIE